MAMNVRFAEERDIEPFFDIWKAGLLASLGMPVPNIERYKEVFRKRIVDHDEPFRIFVAEDSEEGLLGWVSLTPFRSNPVVRDVMAELSAYVHPNKLRSGVVKKLLIHTLQYAATTDLQYVMAFISSTNQAAIKAVESTGFYHVGVLPVTPKSSAPPLGYYTYVVPDKIEAPPKSRRLPKS